MATEKSGMDLSELRAGAAAVQEAEDLALELSLPLPTASAHRS